MENAGNLQLREFVHRHVRSDRSIFGSHKLRLETHHQYRKHEQRHNRRNNRYLQEDGAAHLVKFSTEVQEGDSASIPIDTVNSENKFYHSWRSRSA